MRIRRPLAIALVSSVALAGIVTVTATGASGAAPAAHVQPRVVTGSSALAFVKTINVGSIVYGVAVDLVDDTVYVSVDQSTPLADFLVVIDGRTATVTKTVGLGIGGPQGVAVNQEDDTVYVALNSGSQLSVINGRNTDDSLGVSVGDPLQVAVNQVDDTVYVTRMTNSVSVVDGRTNVARSVPIGALGRTTGVAVNNRDDTVYIANENLNTLAILKGGNTDDSQVRSVVTSPQRVAVDQRDDTVYVGPSSGFALSVLNGRSGTLDDNVVFANTFGSPMFVAVSNIDDTVYVAANNSGNLGVLDGANLDDSFALSPTPVSISTRGLAVDDTAGSVTGAIYLAQNNGFRVVTLVTPTLGTTSGAAGDPVSISATAPHVLYSPDSATVQSVTFGGVAGTSLTAGSPGTWTVTAPAGSGSVPVIVTLNGGQQVNVGTFTYSSSPTPTPPAPPPPVFPPGPPREVVAVAGDASATVSWTAPSDPGSFPVTDYKVTSSPGARTCLVKAPATSCSVTDLTNGTSYTFAVEALSGAGWGQASGPSNAVTPQALPVKSIMITGSRDDADDRFIRVQGTTTDLVGKQVTPYVRFPGQTAYSAGIGVQTVGTDGTFAWQRKTGKLTYVYFMHGEVRSNSVTIRAR